HVASTGHRRGAVAEGEIAPVKRPEGRYLFSGVRPSSGSVLGRSCVGGERDWIQFRRVRGRHVAAGEDSSPPAKQIRRLRPCSDLLQRWRFEVFLIYAERRI